MNSAADPIGKAGGPPRLRSPRWPMKGWGPGSLVWPIYSSTIARFGVYGVVVLIEDGDA
jgi:hypothetical protein